MLLDMTREEKAFILAAIQIKADNDKKEQQKMKSKRPHKGMTPEFTNRDMYKNKEIYKPANASSEYKQRPRLDIDNSHINDTKQNINLTYRIPTLSNYSKTPANNGSKQHLKKPLENKLRFNPPNYQNEIINDKLCSSLNNQITDNNIKQTSRLNDYIIQNLNNNPYINNVIHKSTIN